MQADRTVTLTVAGWQDGRGGDRGPWHDVTAQDVNDAVRELIGGYIERLNAEMNRWETIKKWALLDHDLSIENNELTPSMKVKRSVVEEKQKDLLDSFYE